MRFLSPAKAEEIRTKFGSPLYVYDANTLKQQAREGAPLRPLRPPLHTCQYTAPRASHAPALHTASLLTNSLIPPLSFFMYPLLPAGHRRPRVPERLRRDRPLRHEVQPQRRHPQGSHALHPLPLPHPPPLSTVIARHHSPVYPMHCAPPPSAYPLTLLSAPLSAPLSACPQLFEGLGLHIDASSGFEVHRAIEAGFAPAKISLSSQELPPFFADLVTKGVLINACSLRQVELFGQAFPGGEIGLRINPGAGSGGTGKTNVGGPSSSFGADGSGQVDMGGGDRVQLNCSAARLILAYALLVHGLPPVKASKPPPSLFCIVRIVRICRPSTALI